MGKKTDQTIDLLTAHIESVFENLETYLTVSDHALGMAKEQTQNIYTEELDQAKSQIKKKYIQKIIEDHNSIYDKEISPVLIPSSFVTFYSSFESCFSQICELARHRVKIQVTHNHIRGNGIETHYQYMTKVVGIDLNPLNEIWKELNNYKKIRNSIVHDHANIIKNKELTLEKQDIYKLVISNPHLNVDKKGFLSIVDGAYVFEFSKTARRYLLSVLKKLREVKRRRK